MQITIQRLSLALASAALLTLAACSGSSSTTASVGGGGAVAPAASTSISGVVADGLIKGASACYDLNDNGVCDTGEPFSTETGADGGYLLSVPTAEAGKHNVIVNVPATATDSDAPGVPVGTAFTMKAPPQTDPTKPVFVSPVTTIVTDVMAASGTKDPADAIASVQSQLGMTISPLDNFVDKKINGTVQEQAAAQRVASIAQVVTQLNKQISDTAKAANVSTADARTLISVVVLNNLSNVVTQVDNKGTSTVADLAKAVLVSQNLSTTTIAAQAAAAVTVASSVPETTSTTPKPFLTLRDFRYTDANNYFVRIFEGDDVADADGFKYSTEARQNLVKGIQTEGGVNTAFYSPDKGAWVQCRLNAYKISKYKPQTTTSDATSVYCDSYRDTSRKSTRSIAGSSIADILTEIRAYPFKDGVQSYATWGITPTAIIGSPTFPAGSELQTSVSVQLNKVDIMFLNQKIKKWPGNGPDFSAWPYAATLDDAIKTWGGNYPTAPATGGGTGAGFWTLNAGEVDDPTVTDTTFKKRKRHLVGLQRTTDTTGNARFFACNVKVSDNSQTNCAVTLDTTYTIASQADSRILRFAAYPTGLEAAAGYRFQLTERAGAVFVGQNLIPLTSYILRLNGPAWQALRAALPSTVPAHVLPTAPVALDAASWLRDMRNGTNASGSDTFNIRWVDSVGTTGGKYSEVRMNMVAGNTVTFARNQLLWNGSAWVASDSPDNACRSDGVEIGTWTSNPRSSTGCGLYKDTQSGFDVDISGKLVTTTIAEMRLYGSYGFGQDYSTYGPTPGPSNPNYVSYTTSVFPPGSRLRYQVSTIVQGGENFNVAAGSEVKLANNVTSITNLGSLIAAYTGGFNGVTQTGATTYGVYNFQENNVPAAGTTGQVRVRVGFQALTPTSGNALFVGCGQDAVTKNTINCTDGTFSTTYTITTLGGKSQLVFAAMPDVVSQQGTFIRSFVEHNGLVYAASKDAAGAKAYTLRLNQAAWETIFNIFGVTKPAQTAVAP